jgi:outer membrane protein
MKHFTRLFLVLLISGIFNTLTAQNYKFGHINAQELIALMPERDSAQAKLEIYSKELQESIESMQVEFNTKLNTYQQKQATWSAALLDTKQKELQDLRTRIDEFQQTAQEEFQRMQQSLLRPIIEKANNAIEKIAKQEGFTYIFDLSIGAIPYHNPEHSIDLLPLVKKELNITKELPAN